MRFLILNEVLAQDLIEILILEQSMRKTKFFRKGILTPLRPRPGSPRPICEDSARYLENCANALRQTERDNPLYRYR